MAFELPEYGEWEKVARHMMKLMLYDNGAVNRYEPETEERYATNSVLAITQCAEVFFTMNPSVFTEEDIENICNGELEENQTKYGILKGYQELDLALNEYFDIM